MIGITIPDSEKRSLKHADVLNGHNELKVTFDIWDNRKTAEEEDYSTTTTTGTGTGTGTGINKDKNNRKYIISFAKGTNKDCSGIRCPVLLEREYSKPGRYTVFLPMEPPDAMTLVISMINEHGQYYEETVAISVGTRFYIWFKYLILIPVLLVSLPILMIRSAAPLSK